MITDNMRTEKEIIEYREEAFNRVWLVRKQSMKPEKLSAEILESIDRVCKKHNIDFDEPVSDWEYGYWSGILSSLRWVLGDEKDFLDT